MLWIALLLLANPSAQPLTEQAPLIYITPIPQPDPQPDPCDMQKDWLRLELTNRCPEKI